MLSRGASPTGGEAQVTSDSVPEIGRSLQNARTKAGLSLPDAAIRLGVASSELEALESGTVARMADRVETLRCLRSYANSLGLPGDAYVLTLLELWPSPDLGVRERGHRGGPDGLGQRRAGRGTRAERRLLLIFRSRCHLGERLDGDRRHGVRRALDHQRHPTSPDLRDRPGPSGAPRGAPIPQGVGRPGRGPGGGSGGRAQHAQPDLPVDPLRPERDLHAGEPGQEGGGDHHDEHAGQAPSFGAPQGGRDPIRVRAPSPTRSTLPATPSRWWSTVARAGSK